MLFALEISTTFYVDIGITLFLYVLLIIYTNNLVSKKMTIPFFSCLFISKALATFFELEILSSFLDLFALGVIVGFVSIYSQEIRRKVMARSRKSKIFNNNDAPVQSREVFLHQINEAVMFMSSNKIGGIITFERKDNLEHYIQSGEVINAPVSAVLIKTIFYEGTALHDGAIIIRNTTICAASVYFTPSVKPLIGKFGARHRAALGISEVCDALTVVVSEETGRISFAKRGELISIARDSFMKQLDEYLNEK